MPRADDPGLAHDQLLAVAVNIGDNRIVVCHHRDPAAADRNRFAIRERDMVGRYVGKAFYRRHLLLP